MIENEIRMLADKLGKVLANAIDKHIAAGAAQAGYSTVSGRGGNANGVDPAGTGPKGSGEIPGLDRFKQNANSLAATLDSVDKGITGFMKDSTSAWLSGIYSMFSSSPTKMMEGIVADAQEFANQQIGLQRDVAERTIKYIEANDTNIYELTKTADAMNDYRVYLHALSKTGKGVTAAEGKKLTQLRMAIKLDGKTVKLREELSAADNKRLLYMEKHGATIKESADLLHKMSDSALDASTALGTVSTSVIDTMTDMTEQYSSRMWGGMKIALSTVVAGSTQYFNDTVLQYQAQITRQYKGQAIAMGMSNREVMLGSLEFRDTLRAKAIAEGVLVDDVSLNAIQQLGRTFGLRGDEAFRFALQLEESAKLIGVTGSLSTEEMRTFYGESAKTLNMTVNEFGEYFNTLAKDPAFAGFVNTLGVTGGNMQTILSKEVGTRIRMNKIMGLTNESLRERLALENSKKWAPLVDKYKAQVGSKLLADLFEKEDILNLSGVQKDIMKRGTFDIASLTADERNVFQRDILPAMIGSSSELLKKYDEMMANTTDEGEKMRIARQKGAVQERMAQFGQLAGPETYDTAISDTMQQNLTNMGLASKDAIQAIADGAGRADIVEGASEGFLKIQSALSKAAGDGALLKTETAGLEGDVINIVNDSLEVLSGIAQSGAGKALLGVAGASAMVMWQFGKLSAMLGMFTGAGKGGMLAKMFGLGGKGAGAAGAAGIGSKIAGGAKILGKGLGIGAAAYGGWEFGSWLAETGIGKSVRGGLLDAIFAESDSKLADVNSVSDEDRAAIKARIARITSGTGGSAFAASIPSEGMHDSTKAAIEEQNILKARIESSLNAAGIKTGMAESYKAEIKNGEIVSLNLNGIQQQLEKHIKLLEIQETLKDTTVMTNYEQAMLDNSRKMTENSGKQLTATKEQSQELTGGFAKAAEIAKSAKKSAIGWRATVPDSADRAAQYS